MPRRPALAALALLCACGIDVPPFTGTPPGPDGGAPPGCPQTGLVICLVTPPSGPREGGSPVQIQGGGFEAGAGAWFGGAAALEVVFLSPTRLSVITPPGPTGVVSVKVENPGGASAMLPGAYTYEAP